MSRPTRGHALYVAWGFPPAKSGGVFRMMETANVLVEDGWDVTVLACDIDDLRRYAGVDLSTLAGVDPRIRVVRVPMELGSFETDLLRWDELRVDDPAGWLAQYQARVDAGFPNSVYGLWEEPLVETARQVHAEREVDLVIASGGPFVCFSVGQALLRDHGVPYVLDYRDSWSLQQFTGERLQPAGTRTHTVEDRLLTDAAEVWFVNAPMQRWHEDVYPQIIGKARVVTNGYDAEAVAGLPLPAPHQGGVRFGFLGTVTAAVPLAETLAGYHLARVRDEAVGESSLDFYGYLGFYHTPAEGLRRQLEAAGEDQVQWRGPLPKAEVATAYAELDALVLTFGGTRFVTSGKVFEYMATARPIVNVVAPQNAVREVLQGYPLWFQAASLEPDDVAEAFIAAAAAVRSGHASDPAVVAACLEHAQRFERRRCLRPAISGLAQTAELVRKAAVARPEESDIVAFCGDLEPLGLRHRVAQAGRRLVHVRPVPPIPASEGARASLDQRRAALEHAEPGTIAGRLHRLYEVVGEGAAGAIGAIGAIGDSGAVDGSAVAVDAWAVAVAEQVLASGCGAVIVGDDVPAAVLQWLPRVVPGMPVARLTTATPESGMSEPGIPRTFESAAVAEVLAATPALRLRRSQEPIDEVAADPESGIARAIAAATRAARPAGTGTVVLTSSPTEPGSPVLALAEQLAAEVSDEVLVLAVAREELPVRGHLRRRDEQVGRVRIITLPALEDIVEDPVEGPVEGTGSASKQREDSTPGGSVVALRRRVSDLQDRIELRRHGVPAWEDLFPEDAARAATVLPLLERLEWDTIHVTDPAALIVARQAVERRRRTGRPARWVRHLDDRHLDDETHGGLLARLAYQELISRDTGEQGSKPTVGVTRGVTPGVTPAVTPGSPPPLITPWPRDDLPALIGVGPDNTAGQGWAWAKAIERVAPGVRTEVLSVNRGPRAHLTSPADISVPVDTFDTDRAWMEQFEAHVLDTWTHALLEGGRSVLGSLYGGESPSTVTVLREAGIKVGLVFHGSDLRDPRRHATRTPWSPFTDAHDDLVRRQQRRHDLVRDQLRDYEGPMWVSTPDLLVDLPGARWLPVVVDLSRWATDEPCLERPVPVVVQLPGRQGMTGSETIEAGLADLRRDGLIDYRTLEGVDPVEMPSLIASADIVLDQFSLGTYGMAAVEAMAAGRVVVSHIMADVRAYCPDLPIVEATPKTVDQVLRELLRDRVGAREIAAAGVQYARRWHDGQHSAELLVRELRPVVGGSSRGRLRTSPEQ